MTRHWKLAAAGLAAASVLAWGLTRREASSRPGQEPVPAAATDAPAASAPPPVAAPAEKPGRKPAPPPEGSVKQRGAGLMEKGEALGGTAP